MNRTADLFGGGLVYQKPSVDNAELNNHMSFRPQLWFGPARGFAACFKAVIDWELVPNLLMQSPNILIAG